MSLQVWLPLTKDLRQQGLSNTTVSIMRGNETWDNNGKLGKCFYANGVNTLQINNIIPQLYNANGYSLCAWFYIESQNTVHSGAGIVSGGNWNSQVLNLSVSDWSSDHYTRLRVSGTNWNNTYTYNFYKNIWYHAVVCSDGNKTYAYINGQLIGDTVAGFLPSSIEGNNIAIGGATYYSGMQFFGKINDVRIYDHCLSPMEVKELAKGLMLHYPLNRQGWGQENLLKNSNFLQGTNGMQGYTATSATCTKQTDCMKVVSTSASGGFYSSNFDSITTGDMTTFSADVKADSNMTIYIGTDGSGNGSCQAYTVGTSWQRISISKAKTTNNANLRIYGNGTFYTKNLKYELGSIATPWCPNSADTLATTLGLNGTTEYDCSGYCNNGTRTGTFTWTSDTPKYNVSTAIEKGIITATNSFITTSDPVFSVALWFKLKSGVTYTSYTDLISFSSSSYSNQPFRLEICGSPVGKSIMWFRGPSGQSGGFAVKSDLSYDTWYHTVLVSEGNKQYSYYVDGEKLGTYNGSANSWIPTGNISLGENITGVIYESDFRIYTTALSADDVKSLYQNCATIDPDGTIRGQIHD